MRILIPVLSVLALTVLLAAFVLLCGYKRNVRAARIAGLLKMILCCNNYPRLLIVYTKLDESTNRLGIAVQYNFRGYFG